MAQLIKKENITIVIDTWTDNQGVEKKKYKTIAELVTMRGDDGNEYQFGEIWGPHGVTKFNVYAQEDKNNQQQNNNQGQQQGNYQQQNQQAPAQQNQQGGYSQQGQQQNSHNFNNQNG